MDITVPQLRKTPSKSRNHHASINKRYCIRRIRSICAGLLCLLAVWGCDKQISPPERSTGAPAANNSAFDIDSQAATKHMWQHFSTQNENAIQQAELLASLTRSFLQQPSPESLKNAQQQWHTAEQSLFGLTLLFKITNADTALLQLDFVPDYRLTASPIQPGYLDRYGPYLYSGLVFDIGTPITATSLIHQHGLTDKAEVVLGIYAIEFMLFGENGARSANDYSEHRKLDSEHIAASLNSIEEIPNNRRRRLLQLQIDLLIQDLSDIHTRLVSSPTTSPEDIWSAYGAQVQLQYVHNSVDGILTQALIDIVNLQTSLSTLPSAEQLPEPAREFNGAEAIANIHTKLNTIDAALKYYSDVERATIQNALDQAQQELTTNAINSNNAEQIRDTLQRTYELLKSII